MPQRFVVVQIFLQTGVLSLLNHCCCSPLFAWVGVLLVYTFLKATQMLPHFCTICNSFTGDGTRTHTVRIEVLTPTF